MPLHIIKIVSLTIVLQALQIDALLTGARLPVWTGSHTLSTKPLNSRSLPLSLVRKGRSVRSPHYRGRDVEMQVRYKPDGVEGSRRNGAQDVMRNELKSILLETLEPLERGFVTDSSQRKNVKRLMEDLATYSPKQNPAKELLRQDSSWTLLYSDAPDIVGPGTGNGGLLVPKNGRIGQDINAAESTITNLVEIKPQGLLAPLLPRDVLLLKVELEAEALTDTKIGLKLKGTQAQPMTFANADVSFLPPLVKVRFPLSLGFGEFEIRYYDGDIRIIKTGQGFYSINKLVVCQ